MTLESCLSFNFARDAFDLAVTQIAPLNNFENLFTMRSVLKCILLLYFVIETLVIHYP